MIDSDEFYFWAGEVDEPADALQRGDRFVVVESQSPDAEPILTGEL
jgi:hypothetical protein